MEVFLLPQAKKIIKKLPGNAPTLVNDYISDLSAVDPSMMQSSGDLLRLTDRDLYEVKLIKKGYSYRIITDLLEKKLYILHVFPKKSDNAKKELDAAQERSRVLRDFLKRRL